MGGAGLLYKIALLNHKWNERATKFLYKDPWNFWMSGTDRPLVAKRLIDTFKLCHGTYSPSFNYSNVRKKIRLEQQPHNNNNVEPSSRNPTHDYMAFITNLHLPALLKCVEFWYTETYGSDPNNRDIAIEKHFKDLFEGFVRKAYFHKCTFAESGDQTSSPIKLDQLYNLLKFSRCSKELQYLNMGFFACTNEALDMLTEKCNKLKTFKLKAEHCSDKYLAKFIRSQKCLTKLKIRNAESINETLDALESQSKNMVKLRINACNLESCTKPFYGIAACKELRSLYMMSVENFPENISISYLLMPIAKNCTFHNIDFTRTLLPADVLVEIAKKSSTTLRIRALGNYAKNLMCFERDIRPFEKPAMIEMLSAIGLSLERLEIESCHMIGTDASDLIKAIGQHCSNLMHLDITSYEFSLESFRLLVENCKKLNTLIVSDSPSVNDSILQLIEENCIGSLQTLDISRCENVSRNEIEKLRRIIEVECED
ncbi:7688_t:CDS:2 [Entrophospora sp. SA101]|nr:7688_t:CDS:2 [Entrophospora sp. SA101]